MLGRILVAECRAKARYPLPDIVQPMVKHVGITTRDDQARMPQQIPHRCHAFSGLSQQARIAVAQIAEPQIFSSNCSSCRFPDPAQPRGHELEPVAREF